MGIGILGIDILGIDILGIDILALPRTKAHFFEKIGLSLL